MSLPSSLPNSGTENPYGDEGFSDKMLRKSMQQPLVPVGVIATGAALTLAARAVSSGNQRLANRMMRWRVVFQGLTVVALLGGAYFYGETASKTYSREQELIKLAKERETMWIEELERVDEAAKARKARAEEIHETFLRKRQESLKALEEKEKNALAENDGKTKK